MSNEPFVMERIFNASPEMIWKAITDKDEMRKWYFDLKEFKPEVGFEFKFWGGKDDDHQYLHICEVTEVIPLKKLAYSWRFDGYQGMSYVTFELIVDGKNTKVRLTHAGLETFPSSNSDFAKDNFVTGWTAIIGSNLKDYLEKKV